MCNPVDTYRFLAMEELKTHLLMARGKGVEKRIVSVWSPPAPFKSPLQDTKGMKSVRIGGTEAAHPGILPFLAAPQASGQN